MVRIQVRITEVQAASLRELAKQQGVSKSALVRQAIDQFLSSTSNIPDLEQRRRALDFVGRFDLGASDIAENHDSYLADIYGQVEP